MNKRMGDRVEEEYNRRGEKHGPIPMYEAGNARRPKVDRAKTGWENAVTFFYASRITPTSH